MADLVVAAGGSGTRRSKSALRQLHPVDDRACAARPAGFARRRSQRAAPSIARLERGLVRRPGRAAMITTSRSVSRTSTGGSQHGRRALAARRLEQLAMQAVGPGQHAPAPRPTSSGADRRSPSWGGILLANTWKGRMPARSRRLSLYSRGSAPPGDRAPRSLELRARQHRAAHRDPEILPALHDVGPSGPAGCRSRPGSTTRSCPSHPGCAAEAGAGPPRRSSRGRNSHQTASPSDVLRAWAMRGARGPP